jgi:hypothetical protein
MFRVCVCPSTSCLHTYKHELCADRWVVRWQIHIYLHIYTAGFGLLHANSSSCSEIKWCHSYLLSVFFLSLSVFLFLGPGNCSFFLAWKSVCLFPSVWAVVRTLVISKVVVYGTRRLFHCHLKLQTIRTYHSQHTGALLVQVRLCHLSFMLNEAGPYKTMQDLWEA